MTTPAVQFSSLVPPPPVRPIGVLYADIQRIATQRLRDCPQIDDLRKQDVSVKSISDAITWLSDAVSAEEPSIPSTMVVERCSAFILRHIAGVRSLYLRDGGR